MLRPVCIKSGCLSRNWVSGQHLLCLQVNGPKEQTGDTDLSIFTKQSLHALMTHFRYVIVLRVDLKILPKKGYNPWTYISNIPRTWKFLIVYMTFEYWFNPWFWRVPYDPAGCVTVQQQHVYFLKLESKEFSAFGGNRGHMDAARQWSVTTQAAAADEHMPQLAKVKQPDLQS